MAMSGRLGAMLVSSGLITDEQLKKALAAQKTEGGRLGSLLVKLGFVPEDKLMTFLSKQYGVPYVDLSKFEINPAVIKHIPADVAQKYRIMPINRAGATITIAMVDPSNIFVPTNATKDGRFHKLKVAVVDDQGNPLTIFNQKGKKVKYHIVARDGYYAPKS